MVRANNGEIYFEPGDREDVSIEDLVKMWKQYGFQKIYVAGWHIYPEWTYDYGRLIELAHENAMLVYLWLKIPHVNRKFWDEHPNGGKKQQQGKRPSLTGVAIWLSPKKTAGKRSVPKYTLY